MMYLEIKPDIGLHVHGIVQYNKHMNFFFFLSGLLPYKIRMGKVVVENLIWN